MMEINKNGGRSEVLTGCVGNIAKFNYKLPLEVYLFHVNIAITTLKLTLSDEAP